jgi:hypothetical protein
MRQEEWLPDPTLATVVNLTTAAASGRFGKAALRRINDVVKMAQEAPPGVAGLAPSVNVALMDDVHTALFHVDTSKPNAPLSFAGMRDARMETFVHIKFPLSYCDECSKVLTSVRRVENVPRKEVCGRCLVACYCSKECQTAHWRTHRPLCKAIAFLPVGQAFNQPVLEGRVRSDSTRDVAKLTSMLSQMLHEQ